MNQRALLVPSYSRLADNPVVLVASADVLDVALRQLKRRLDRFGLFAELKRRAAAESPGLRRRRKRAHAVKRAAKRAARQAAASGAWEWR